jgi:hypothetical protein
MSRFTPAAGGEEFQAAQIQRGTPGPGVAPLVADSVQRDVDLQLLVVVGQSTAATDTVHRCTAG